MDQRQNILRFMTAQESCTTQELAQKLDISVQAVLRHLRILMEEGAIYRTGTRRAARYQVVQGLPPSRGRVLEKRYPLRKLEEDRVWREIELSLNVQQLLGKNSRSIARYAFTEMLNNAIDHSRANEARISVTLSPLQFEFEITDRGVGVFESIRKGFRLKNHLEAVEHLLKGKQTTQPEQHSGQGIFFTSKCGDLFILESDKIRLTFNNLKKDISLGEIPRRKGTKVSFMVNRRTNRTLAKLFRSYANDEFEFDRTAILVKLSVQIDGHVSRSQAKRLLNGLEQYRKIIFDFSGVSEVGQGFVDEIFRVFQNRYPEILLEPKNMNSAVRFMVNRTKREK